MITNRYQYFNERPELKSAILSAYHQKIINDTRVSERIRSLINNPVVNIENLHGYYLEACKDLNIRNENIPSYLLYMLIMIDKPYIAVQAACFNSVKRGHVDYVIEAYTEKESFIIVKMLEKNFRKFSTEDLELFSKWFSNNLTVDSLSRKSFTIKTLLCSANENFFVISDKTLDNIYLLLRKHKECDFHIPGYIERDIDKIKKDLEIQLKIKFSEKVLNELNPDAIGKKRKRSTI